jgi:hypothetical protein
MSTPPSTPVDNDGGFQFFNSFSFFSHSLQGSVAGRQKLRYFLLEKAFFYHLSSNAHVLLKL